MMAQDFISNNNSKHPISEAELKQEHKTVVYRHIAWLTALRYAMRQPRSWEYVMREHTNIEWANKIYVPEFNVPFDEAIKPYLTETDLAYIANKTNKQTAILYLQSNHLKQLKERGLIWEFSFLELQNVLEELFTHQGKSERIKNFPYPRQFASLMHYFTWIFLSILPLAMASQFGEIAIKISEKVGTPQDWIVWVSIPFSIVVIVDHRQPNTFSVIVDRFIELNKIEIEKIEYIQIDGGPNELKDDKLKQEFRKYHQDKANLRIVKKDLNLGRSFQARVNRQQKDLKIKEINTK